MDVIGYIRGFLDIHSAISFLVGLLPAGYLIYKLISFLIRKELRLFKNLNRKVYLMTTDKKISLQREKTLLQENGLYHIHNNILDLSDNGLLETTEKFSIFVIGYSQKFSGYQKIIERAKRDSIPTIFLASPQGIKDKHMELFRTYPYFEMCNTSARLLTTIFNLSVITPYDKR